MINAAVGIDIGGTFTKFGIVDERGFCLATDFFGTGLYRDVDAFQKHLYEEIQIMARSLNKKIYIRGIGVGAPNGNYFHGTIEHAPNLNWRGIIPFTKKFRKYFPGISVVLTNDAKAAAIGEMVYGGAKKMKNFIAVTLGTGLGCAFVADGCLVYGHEGRAGELGHVNARRNGRLCRCGNRGCLETYVSAAGIKKTFFTLLKAKTGKSVFRNKGFQDLTSEMICHAAREGDSLALEAFSRTGEILGMKLSEAVAMTNPEAIFLSGGLARAGELIFKPTLESLEKNLFPVFRGTVKLLPSKLMDRNAAILGAAALVRKRLNKE